MLKHYKFSQLLFIRTFILLVLFLTSKALACDKTITISAAENWPPFSYYEDNSYKGLDIEIIEHVLVKANLCWRYVSYPSSSRAFIEFEKGYVDLIFAASFNEKRSKYALFSTPYRNEIMQLFTNANNKKNVALTTNSSIAINRGSYYGALFEQYIKQCNECIVETSLVKERINLVKFNRVDYAVEELLAASHVIRSEDISDVVIATNFIVNSTPVHLMLNPKNFNKSEMKALNEAIIASDDTIYKLVEKYQEQLAL